MIPEPDKDNDADGEMDTLCAIALPSARLTYNCTPGMIGTKLTQEARK